MAIKIQQTTVIEDTTRNVLNVGNVTADGRVYAGGVFFENPQTLNYSYTVTNRNAMSSGPVTIAPGSTVTISAGARWIIV